MDDLRTLLHALADRVAATLDASPTASGATPPSPSLVAAVRALAEGDLSPSRAAALEHTPEGAAFAAAVTRVRGLVGAARAAVAGGTDRLDELPVPAAGAAGG